MNTLILNGNLYNLIGFWKKNKTDNSVDSNGVSFEYPQEHQTWSGQSQFIEHLKNIEQCMNEFEPKKVIPYSKNTKCLLCKDNLNNNRYIYDNFMWSSTLIHYIEKHNYEPPRFFIDSLFSTNVCNKNKYIQLQGRVVSNKKTFLKLEKNQLMILDALMKHGGYNKKYHDMGSKNIVRYSEHAGFFDIRNNIVQNIIVSGNTLRVDRGDEEIFLPMNTPDTFKYEYIFHTHPPTPKPGGRAKLGILYEFPSLGDIFHFIDHHNEGNVIGSMVMTPEGLYNIRNNTNNKIKINEEKFYVHIKKIFRETQQQALKKYGSNFTTYKFYSVIAQDDSFIDNINLELNKYGLFIDFFPREKDFKGSWIVDTIYIPLKI